MAKKNLDPVKCKECGYEAHILIKHLADEHGLTPEEYTENHPGAKVISELAEERLAQESKQGRNERALFNVKDFFGVKLGVEKVKGWMEPWQNTPAIDPDYVFHKELLNPLLCALEDNMKVLLVGPTGSGKTSCPTQICARLNLPLYKMSFDGEIGRSEFVGQYVLTGPDKMEFIYGVLPRAMKEGAVLILDEWDMMRADITGVLQSVLEPGGSLTILETGETIYPHENFRVISTANTTGSGDETGLYAGTEVQNYAARDRWNMCLTVDYPDKRTETKVILQKTGIGDFAKENGAKPNELVNNFLKVAELIRDSFKKDQITCTMSTRTIINVASLYVKFGDMKMAWNVGYVNKLNSDDSKVVKEFLQRVFAIR